MVGLFPEQKGMKKHVLRERASVATYTAIDGTLPTPQPDFTEGSDQPSQ
jgi:hypothetical protein